MKLRLRKPDCIGFLLFTILVLECNFFYLIPMGNLQTLNSPTNKYLIVILSFIGTFLVLKYTVVFYKKHPLYSVITVYIIFCLFLLIVFSLLKYNQSFFDIWTKFYHFFSLTLVVPLLYKLETDKGIKKIINTILFCSTVFSLICLLQSKLYNSGGHIVLPGLTSDMISIRTGKLRLSANSVFHLGFIILLSKISDVTKSFWQKRIDILLFIIHFLTVIFVFMSRSLLVIFIVTFIFIYLANTQSSKLFRLIILGIGSVCAIHFLDISSFIDSFSVDTTAGTALSTSNRLEALEYFTGVFRSNPIFGMGFIRESLLQYRQLLHGPNLTYYVTDIGFLGLLGESGILGGLIFIFLTYYLYIKIRIINSNKLFIDSYSYSLAYGLFSFWLLTSISLIVTNPRYSVSMPFIIAIEIFISERSIQNRRSRSNETC